MKKRICLILFTLLLCMSTVVHANTVEQLKIDVFIDCSGDASVTENWKYRSSQNTEMYHAYKNLADSKIIDLNVWRDGIGYETISAWNINGSFESKKDKCGIYYGDGTTEICWGIGEYGTHDYKVTYTITDFVKQLSDSQLIYWELVSKNSETRKDVTVTIRSDKYFENEIPVWGYGNYGGLAYISEGKIEMASDGALDENEYMTILVKLPVDMFDLSNDGVLISKPFEEYYAMAEEGAMKYEESEDYDFTIIGFFTFFIIFMGIVFASCTNVYAEYSRKINKKIELDDAEYYRDIPCNKDILDAYFIAYEYKILNKKTDVLGSIILKWIKEKRATIEVRKVGLFKKKDDNCLILNKDFKELNWENEYEKELYSMMLKASGDGVLERKELEKWSQNQYGKLFKWFDDVLNSKLKKFTESGEIVPTKGKYYEDTTTFETKGREIAGLKKYLKEYSLIKDRKAIEVELFEDYLIFAQMVGIAATVASQFNELYPDVKDTIAKSFTYNDYMFVSDISRRSIRSASKSREAARAAARSYSSGGGGFSSGGGGGGSFGGGGSSGSR